ncbi:MAG: amino acid racemase [Hyphomonadaceae bacterium]
MSETKSVGVIGGLGPAATLDFFDRILKRTKALHDQDHLRLIIDNNTKIPDRNAYQRGDGPSPGPALAAAAHALETVGAEFIVMACNTAHAWEAEIRAAISVPFISIIEETTKVVADLKPERAGVLAVDACLASSLYQDALKKAGVAPVLLNADSQRTFMELIYRIKSGDTRDMVRRSMSTLARKLEAQGAEVIIAGCTEVPLVLTADDINNELVNSTDVLVERTICFAGGELK